VTIVEPLPVNGYGKSTWVDYSNYWREADSGWLQERSILRYADSTLRNTQYPTPKFGQVTYNESALGANLDRLEMYSKQHNTWVPILMLANITSSKDDTAGVALGHKLAGGKGVQFQPTQTLLDNPILVMGGVLYVDSDSVDIKTGAKTVKLTTSATGLVVDSPLSATALSTAGALTAASLTVTGTLTAPNIAMSGTLTGGTFRGVVDGTTVNASTGGTLGGVAISGNLVQASTGFISMGAYLRGDAGTGYLSHRAGDGTLGAPTLTVDNTYVRFRASNGMPVDRHDGNHTGGWVGVVFTSDPGASNAPNGSILLT